MATKPDDDLEIVEDKDLIVPLKPGRKTSGSDVDPIDDETGEPLFVDTDPNFPGAKDADEPEEEDEEEIEAVEEDEPEEEEEEDEPPQKKSSFQKRLARERRLREEMLEDVADLQAEVRELNAKLTTSASDDKYNSDGAAIDAKIATTRTELEAAKEAGDTKKEIELIERLADLKGDRKVLDTQHKAAKEAVANRSTAANAIVNRKVEQWIRKHPRFRSDPVFGDAVRAIDKQVAKEGFDPSTKEFYDEVDKRASKLFPDEYKGRKPKDDEDEPQQKRRHPSQNFRRGTAGGDKKTSGNSEYFSVKGNRAVLTPRGQKVMREFQLDPQDANDVRTFISQNR